MFATISHVHFLTMMNASVAALLSAPPLGEVDFATVWGNVWPWTWPSVGLVVWLIVAVWVGVRWRRWVERRLAAGGFGVSDRFVRNVTRIVMLGVVLVGLYVWALIVPFQGAAHEWVRNDAQPWVFATIFIAAFLALGFYAIRRGILWLETRAAQTETSLDDALVEALNRPLYVTLVLVSLNLWAAIVPMPAALQGYVSKGTQTTIIVLIILFADGLVQGWMIARSERSKVLKTSGTVLRTTARVIFYAIGALMALTSIGFDVTPVLATLGIGSAAAGFALKGTLEDFIAGLLIAADQPLSVGDYVMIEGGQEGWVLTIGWRTTRLLTRFDMKVVVPNSKLAAASFVNTSRPREEIRFHAIVPLSFKEDLDEAVRIATEIGEEVQRDDPRAISTYRALAYVERFLPSQVEMRCWLCAKSWDAHFGLYDNYLRRLSRAFKKAGIAITPPVQQLETRAGEAVGVVVTGEANRVGGSGVGGAA